MNRFRRFGKLSWIFGGALLVATTVAVVWAGALFPPPSFLWRYGLDPQCRPIGDVITALGIEFIEIGPGAARVGSASDADPGTILGRFGLLLRVSVGEQPKFTDQMPVHWVEFPTGFALSRTEITNEQFLRYLDSGAAAFEASSKFFREMRANPKVPAHAMSIQEAMDYAAWVARETGLPVKIPHEDLWETACRAGTRGTYYFGEDPKDLPRHGWVSGERFDPQDHTAFAPVGLKLPNPWGFYDLYGNVNEYCVARDGRPVDGAPPRTQLIRGGAAGKPLEWARSSHRDWELASGAWMTGIRLAVISD